MANHLLTKVVLDISYTNKNKVGQLQNKFSKLMQDLLPQVIDEVCNECCDQTSFLQLDTVELSIGQVKESELNTVWVERVKEELKAYLKAQSNKITKTTQQNQSNPVNADHGNRSVELLQHYLQTGTLPWWNQKTTSKPLKQIIDDVLKLNKADCVNVIKSNLKNNDFIKRLVFNFSEAQRHAVIQFIAPIETKFVTEVIKTSLVQYQKNPFISTNLLAYKTELWAFVLSHLLVDKGNGFNKLTFVRSMLKDVSKRLNINYEDFLLHLKNNSEVFKAVPSINFYEVLAEIFEIELREYSTEIKQSITQSTFAKSELQHLLNKKQLSETDKIKIQKYLTILHESEGVDFAFFFQEQKVLTCLRDLQNEESLFTKAEHLALFELEKNLARHVSENQKMKKIINYFFDHGSFQASEVSFSKMEIRTLLKQWLNTQPSYFIEYIQINLNNNQKLKRLAALLSYAEITKLTILMQPSSGNELSSLVSGYKKFIEQSKTSQFSQAGMSELLKVSLLFALGSLKNTSYDIKKVVKKILIKLVELSNSTSESLLNPFMLYINKKEQNIIPNSLFQLLHELNNELKDERTPPEAEVVNISLVAKINWFEHMLTKQNNVWWGMECGLKLGQFNSVFNELFERKKETLASLLLSACKQPESRKFMVKSLSEKSKIKVIKLLAPVHFKTMVSYVDLLKQLKQSSAVGKAEFKLYLWDAVFQASCFSKGTSYNLKTFVIETLQHMTHVFKGDFQGLMIQFMDVASSPVVPISSPFVLVIKELKKVYAKKVGESKDHLESIRKITEQENVVKIVAQLKTNSFISEQVLIAIKENISARNEHKTRQLISALKKAELLPDTLVQLFNLLTQNEQLVLIDVLTNNNHLFVKYYLSDFNKIYNVSNWFYGDVKEKFIQAIVLTYLVTNQEITKDALYAYYITGLTKQFFKTKKATLKTLDSELQMLEDELVSTILLSHNKIKNNIATDTKKQSEALNVKATPKGVPYDFKKKKDSSSVAFHTDNAGLVLLWPFLTQFFTLTNLMENNEFKNIDAAMRATVLTQFLVTGITEINEFDLMLNKVLCGVPTDMPVRTAITISEEEKEISESLLKGVLGNWQALKDTSIAGFRDTFLERKGVMTFEQDAVMLHVEKKTVDILLDSLPWSFSVVKQPWMKKMIQVLWR